MSPARPVTRGVGVDTDRHSLGHATAAVIVTITGLVTGVATLLAQGVLPDAWNVLANSGAIWLLPAFLIGGLMATQRWSALAGFGTLLCALTGYYLGSHVAHGNTGPMRDIAVWAGTAVLGGPLFGVAGYWWRSGSQRFRSVGVALIGAVFIAEGVHAVWRIENHRPAGWVEIGIGLLVPLVLARSVWDRAAGVVLLGPLALLGVGAYETLDAVFLRL